MKQTRTRDAAAPSVPTRQEVAALVRRASHHADPIERASAAAELRYWGFSSGPMAIVEAAEAESAQEP